MPQLWFKCWKPCYLVGSLLDQWIKNGVIVVQYWPSQAYFSTLLHMFIATSVLIYRHDQLLQIPTNINLLQPLRKILNLLGFVISGNHSRQKIYQEKLKTSSCSHGDTAYKNDIPLILKNCSTIVLNGMKVALAHL